jgi:DUF1365 family protein
VVRSLPDSQRLTDGTRESEGLRVPTLYDAVVMHSRQAPMVNRFRYRVSYWLVNYDDLPRRRGLMGRLVRFERSDHCDVRALLDDRGVHADRVLMLAMARSFGHVFNPLSVFWCYDGDRRVAVLAEVHNTYGESYTYFLEPDGNDYFTVEKAMYVSPFYPVDGHYDIRVSEPGSSVSVSVTLRRASDTPFIATLHGVRQRAPLASLMRRSLRRPAVRVAFLIRWQAFRLWRRGLRVQPR